MADIDLIPQEYRVWLHQQAILKKYLAVIVIVVCAVSAAGFALGNAAKRAEQRIVVLKSQNAITQQQHARLDQLKAQQAEFEQQWSLLRGLRAGAAVEDIFNLVDRAIVRGDLWFLDWNFRRAGVVVDGQQRGVETGYFIIASPDEQAASSVEWQVETHMTIHGQAKDHQALSTFVRALFDQSDIRDVNVQKTALTDYANGRVVEFDVTVILNSALKDI